MLAVLADLQTVLLAYLFSVSIVTLKIEKERYYGKVKN